MGGPLHCVLPNTNFIITSVLIGPRPTQPQFSSKLPTMCHAVSCLAHFSGLGPPPQPKPPDYDFCLHSRGYLRVILAFCYRSRWISSFPPPRPVTTGSYTGRMGMNSTHTCNRLNTLSFPLYDYPAKITHRACLQFSQDHFGDPINLDSDSSVDYPQTIKKRRVKPDNDLQEYATINVTNDFLASPSRHGHNVRHVATSGKPQFTAMEERVIGLNE